MSKRTLPLGKAYTLLEPGPVVLITTAHKDRRNIMTLSWHCMMEFEPPLVGIVMSERNDSFALLKASRECVINIPAVELAQQVVAVGNSHGRKIDKFAAFGLTATFGARVKAPLIDPAQTSPRTLHHRGRGAFMIAGETIKLPSRMK